MADTMTLTEVRDLLGMALAHGGSHISIHRTPARNAYDAIDAAIKQREQDAKDAERYRWWRRNARAIEQDEAGLDGLAFDSQVPLETIENASDEELFDLIADAAMAEEPGR